MTFDPVRGEAPPLKLPEAEVKALGLDSETEHYKGFPIVSLGWQHPSHAWRKESFYVKAPASKRTPTGTVGWVPWVGSQIVWPWEAAWIQDLRQQKGTKPDTK